MLGNPVGDHTARIALAPGRGISYQIDTSQDGVLVVRSDGTNPMLVLASLEAWYAEVGEAIKSYRGKWRDMLPAQDAPSHAIEVDEEVYGFLKLKEKENISPNRSLRYLLFGENPYDDPEKAEDLRRASEAHAQVELSEPDSLQDAREDLEYPPDMPYGQD